MDSDSSLVDSSVHRSLLITPGDRVQFVRLYVLATVVSWLVVQFVLLPLILQPLLRFTGSIQVRELLIGATLGFAQWLVLRRYIPVKYWVAATALGALGSVVIYEVWSPLLVVPPSQPVDPQTSLGNLSNFGGINAPPSLPVALLASLLTPLLQGLILSRYTRFAMGWLLVPTGFTLMLFVFGVLNVFLSFISQQFLQFSMPILIPGCQGTMQAIALCLFPRSRGESLEVEETSNRPSLSLPQLTVVTLLVVGGVALLVGSLEILLLRLQMTIR
ncbi:hypothetical protein H6G89_26155 [Oscillatoria sp. FACHB-1407]|uniref:hypothetical protein n=1 Tax=Oscillatoria sp. FACHB-1407 TaxID=2692847 RepID=UPI0016870995|nr:hypothetical protein [Oscillatoria sp. FACHB-1407]MBD2464494.1 hypothetical protein [Oscillatoria sp. FACHB-1407]